MALLRTAAIVAAALSASPATARHFHHRVAATRSEAYPYRTWGGWEAEANARATLRQQNAPGLTEELAPDAKETATGGPVGGVPGFSGR